MMQNMYTAMGISPEVYEYGEQTLVSLKDRFDEIDKTAEYNQLKVLKAMQDCRVSEACLLGTTGLCPPGRGYRHPGLARFPARIWHQVPSGRFKRGRFI